LIAEDDSEMRDLLAETLSGKYDVVTVRDGEEALDIMEEAPFDLLITDKKMPRMGGIELLDLIHSRGNDHPPVIIITAFANESSSSEVYEKGAFLYLSKPFRMEEMLDAVRLALDDEEDA
jgi:two-component system response regulator PilR (NtrC family)